MKSLSDNKVNTFGRPLWVCRSVCVLINH